MYTAVTNANTRLRTDMSVIKPEYYARLGESCFRGVSDAYTGDFILKVIEHKFRQGVENITVLFAGNANEIRSVIAAYPINILYLLDLYLDTEVLAHLAQISQNPDIEIVALEGDAFETCKDIPDSSQDIVTLYGAEFLFEFSASASQLAHELDVSLVDVVRYHKTALVEQVHRILKPGGIILFTVSKDLEELFSNEKGFEKIIGSVFQKKIQ